MKKCSYICGVHAKNIILFAVAGIFISALGEYRNHGLPIPSDFCTAMVGNVLGGTGDSAALFLHPYYNFSFAMPRTMKDCKDVQGASIATCNPTTTGNPVFHFENASQVRVTMIDGEPWFVALDVCRILGISNYRKFLSLLEGDEARSYKICTNGATALQSTWHVSESGLYTLIFRCHDAIKSGTASYRFRKWVTSEVLPSIRKKGEYVMPDQKTVRLKRLRALEDEIEAWKERYGLLSREYMNRADQSKELAHYKLLADGYKLTYELSRDTREMMRSEILRLLNRI